MAKPKSYKKRLPKYAPGGETDDPRKRMAAEAAKRKSSIALPDISFVQPSGKETGYLKEEEKKKKVAKREADIARVMKNPAIKSRKQAEDFLKMKAKEAYRGPDRLSETPEEQSSIGKFIDVAAHPGLALDIYRTTGTLPDYFAEKPIPGVTGIMDIPYSFTGVGTAAGIAKAGKDLPSQIMEGDWAGVGTNLLSIAPGLRNIKGITRKGVDLSKNLGTMAYQRALMPSNVGKIKLSDVLDNQKIADKVSKIADEQSTLYRGISADDPELAKTFLTTPGGTGQGVYGSPYSRVYVSNAGLGSTAEGYTYGKGYVGKLKQQMSDLEGKTPLQQLRTIRSKGQNYAIPLKLDKSKVDDILSSAADAEEKQFILNEFEKLKYKVSPEKAREILTQAKNPDRLLQQATAGLKEGERLPEDVIQSVSKKLQEQQKLTLNKPGPLEAHQVLADEVQANLFKAHGKEFFEHDIAPHSSTIRKRFDIKSSPGYAHRTYIDPKLEVVEQTPIFDYNLREGSRAHEGIVTPGAAPAYTHIYDPTSLGNLKKIVRRIDQATPDWVKLTSIGVPAVGVTGALFANPYQSNNDQGIQKALPSLDMENQIPYDPTQQSNIIPQQKYGGYMAGRLNRRKGLPGNFPRYEGGSTTTSNAQGFNPLSLVGPAIGLMGAFQQPKGQMDYGTSDYFQDQNQAEGQSKAATAAIARGLSFVPGWGQAASLGLQGAQALSGLVGQKDAYGMAPTGFQQGASALLDPVGSLVSAAHGQNPFSRKEKMREVGSLYQDMSAQKTTDQQDAYTQNVKAAEGQYLEYGGYMRKYPDGGPKYGYLKGNSLSDWWYNTDKVQGTYKMATDLDPFLKNWLLDPETQKRLKSNLENTYNPPDPKTLTKEAISRLYKLPMYSRELVKKAGISQDDIEYNNTLQGWKTPSSILGSPYFSGDPGELGVYMPDYHVSMLNDFNNPGTIIHEQTHATGPFQKTMENVIFNKYWDKKQNVDEKFVKQFGRYTYDDKYNKVYESLDKVKEKYPGIYNEYKTTDKYLDKDGMYPRIMDIRKTLNLKPGQKVDKSILNNSAIDLPVSDLRNYYEDDVIIDMLNTLAKNDQSSKPTNLKSAKYGGLINYANGGRIVNPYAKEPNAEIENEVVDHANGGIQDFSHLPRHENATDKNLVNMEDGSFVFSNRIKNPATGNYFAKDAKPLNTLQQEKILADGNTTPLTVNGAKLMIGAKKLLSNRLKELHEATKIYNGAQKAENEATEEFIGMLGGMYGKGGLIKRKDGSYSPRGLWDNIRANRGSGKKPTKAMLEQERKIKAKEKAMGGYMYAEGGSFNNPGFMALPKYVQAKIKGNYEYGGYTLGESYDMSEDEIKELKRQGYTFDIE